MEEFLDIGSSEIAKKLFLSGEVKPHPMYYNALVAAEQERDVFSFDRAEKAELKGVYMDIMAEIGG